MPKPSTASTRRRDPIEAFCVETIRDIRGNPVEGAPVVFTREPQRHRSSQAELVLGAFDTRGQTVLRPARSGCSTQSSCRTNGKGQAGVCHQRPCPGLVNVDAENIATRGTVPSASSVIRCLRFAGDGATCRRDGPTVRRRQRHDASGPRHRRRQHRRRQHAVAAPAAAAPSRRSAAGSTATVVSLAGTPVPQRRRSLRRRRRRRRPALEARRRRARLREGQAVPGRSCQRRGQDREGPDHARDADWEGEEAGRADAPHEHGRPRRQPRDQQARPDSAGVAPQLANALAPPRTRKGPHAGPSSIVRFVQVDTGSYNVSSRVRRISIALGLLLALGLVVGVGRGRSPRGDDEDATTTDAVATTQAEPDPTHWRQGRLRRTFSCSSSSVPTASARRPSSSARAKYKLRGQVRGRVSRPSSAGLGRAISKPVRTRFRTAAAVSGSTRVQQESRLGT